MKALQYLKEKYESENNVQYFAEPDLPMTTSLERICKYMQEYAESHAAAHTAALRERVKELEERLSEERFHTMGFSDALGGANFRLDAMKAENERYRKSLDMIAQITSNQSVYDICREALKQQDNE